MEFNEQEKRYFRELASNQLEEIYDQTCKTMRAKVEIPENFARVRWSLLRCFAVAQEVTLRAYDDFMLYHEGKAFDMVGQKSVRHAWNTCRGEVIDLSWPPNLYRGHQSEKEFTQAEVQAARLNKTRYNWLTQSWREAE